MTEPILNEKLFEPTRQDVLDMIRYYSMDIELMSEKESLTEDEKKRKMYYWTKVIAGLDFLSKMDIDNKNYDMGAITREAIKKMIIEYTEEMDVLRAKEDKTPKDEVRFMDLNTLIDTANNVLKDPEKYEVKFND